MTSMEDDNNLFPDDTTVWVKFPRCKAEERADPRAVAVAGRHDRAAVRPR